MSDQNLDYAAIRRNIKKSVQRQKRLYRMIFFWMHVIFFVVTMAGVWITALADSQLRAVLFNGGSGAAVIVILPTVLWAFAILCHLALLFVESGAAEKAMRQKLLMSEVGEEILRKGLTDNGMLEKPKRRAAGEAKRTLLSDDGEFIDVDEDERLEQRSYTARANHADDS